MKLKCFQVVQTLVRNYRLVSSLKAAGRLNLIDRQIKRTRCGTRKRNMNHQFINRIRFVLLSRKDGTVNLFTGIIYWWTRWNRGNMSRFFLLYMMCRDISRSVSDVIFHLRQLYADVMNLTSTSRKFLGKNSLWQF